MVGFLYFFVFGCVQTAICGGLTKCKFLLYLVLILPVENLFLNYISLLKFVMELDGCSNRLGSSKAKYEAPFTVK